LGWSCGGDQEKTDPRDLKHWSMTNLSRGDMIVNMKGTMKTIFIIPLMILSVAGGSAIVASLAKRQRIANNAPIPNQVGATAAFTVVDTLQYPAPTLTPTPSPKTPVVDSITGYDFSPIEREIFNLVNLERSRVGLNQLAYSGGLDRSSQEWSNKMNSSRNYDHGPYGTLMQKNGISYRTAGENIHNVRVPLDTPSILMYGGSPTIGGTTYRITGWMQSPQHKQNILDPNWTHFGVGGTKGYWTQHFAELIQ